jgi:hypothetical protein
MSSCHQLGAGWGVPFSMCSWRRAALAVEDSFLAPACFLLGARGATSFLISGCRSIFPRCVKHRDTRPTWNNCDDDFSDSGCSSPNHNESGDTQSVQTFHSLKMEY